MPTDDPLVKTYASDLDDGMTEVELYPVAGIEIEPSDVETIVRHLSRVGDEPGFTEYDPFTETGAHFSVKIKRCKRGVECCQRGGVA